MIRRFRFLAALLALVAFSAYFAEGVVAAACAPGSPQHAEIATDTPHGTAGHSHGAPAHEAPAESPHQSQCPFGMGGSMTCVAAPLPGTAIAVQPSPASNEGTFIPQQVSIALLLVHPLYQPPRA
jgi:hypothetical protein